MNKKKKIAVVTGSRAEYGLLYWILKFIQKDPDLKLQLIVTGSHLSTEFGKTINKIIEDGFKVSKKINILKSSDKSLAVVEAMAKCMHESAQAFSKLKPDLLLVLGDRYEIFSTVTAALILKIPIAHIHGGELSEGAYDESFRHAITKMSHYHFTTAEEYRKRVIQMGEIPQRVFCFGAPGLDSIDYLNFLNKKELLEDLGVSTSKKIGVVAFHPATLEKSTAKHQIISLITALKKIKDIFWIMTLSNADTGGRDINFQLKKFQKQYPEKGKVFSSLGSFKYLSLLKNADILVGNSSSGIIEAPCFYLPFVNIGERQRGRIKLSHVIDVDPMAISIAKGIKKGSSRAFQNSLKYKHIPFKKKHASKNIVEKIKRLDITHNCLKKAFHDI